MGVLKLHGLKVFSKTFRRDYLGQLPGDEERGMMARLYLQHDWAIAQWKDTLKEVERVGQAFWEVREFQRLPKVGPIAADVFRASSKRRNASTPKRSYANTVPLASPTGGVEGLANRRTQKLAKNTQPEAVTRANHHYELKHKR